ncbi:hypothetical protein CPB84DRAFT_1840910 [Gymnopilus junonius]|uniref:DUF4050 domain-containing protein n=1 Tax=Gymnopilus junonius TaxID=109634 RepID=A0A9P5TV21_GYMJU|nr:hypothetical protein CPB84DRAFT_1840910 [Gymnopilus junonius]
MASKPPLSFDDSLRSSPLPSPGPEYYEARRRLWLTPPVTPPERPPSAPSTSRQRLQDLFDQPGAIYSQEAWTHDLEKVWRGLSSGGRLKYNLPLPIIIKIIHAAWLRDRTWPVGMEAPDSDEEQQAQASATPETSVRRPNALQPVQYNSPATTPARSDVMEPAPPWATITRT